MEIWCVCLTFSFLQIVQSSDLLDVLNKLEYTDMFIVKVLEYLHKVTAAV
jgi:hypothetical protein